MTTTPKTLQALTTTTSFIDTDFLVTSSSVTGNTTKIAKQPFIDAIGNPVIDGYNSVLTDEDQYTLTPVAGNAVSQYYNKMTISFVAPADSVGNVELRISGLAFKNFYQYNTAITVDVVAGEYYEAVYIDGAFYQTNASAVTPPTLTGYNSSTSAPNQISLTSINGVNIGTYRDNLKVSFISPITSTGNVNIQIDGLALRTFYKYDTVNAVELEIGEYYEAIYVGNAGAGVFYLTNEKTATLFSNEYTAVGTVALDELSTTYQLTSAIGAPKTGYYDAMSLLFTADISSKGVVFVNVDGLGDKVLGEGANDPIANNLYAGQPLLCTYDGTEFIKHRFAVTNPPAPPIDPEEPIPDENLVNINVGPSRPIKTITNAIKALVEEFGNDGGNRLATIHLDADFMWNASTDRITIPADRDYSWITITNASTIPIDYDAYTLIYTQARSVGAIIEGLYTVSGINGAVFGGVTDGLHIIKDASFSNLAGNCTLFQNSTIAPNVQMENVNTTGFQRIIGSSINNTVKATNCTFLEFSASFNGTITGGTLRLNNCTIDSTINTNPGGVIALSTEGEIEAIDCTVGSASGIRLLVINNMANGSLTNCRFISRSNSQIGVEAGASSRLLIDGGDYRTLDNSTVATNIVAASSSIITLTNSPLGGTSAVTGGQIVTI